jgi:hypothetical protein
MVTRQVRHAPLVLLLCLAGLAAGCGASARTQALRTGLLSLNIARDTARATSKEREKQIVDGCNAPTCTKEEGHAKLDAWRVVVDAAYAAIDDGYDAILAALVLDDAKSTIDAGAAIAKALELVKGMKNPAAKPAAADKADKPDKEKTP